MLTPKKEINDEIDGYVLACTQNIENLLVSGSNVCPIKAMFLHPFVVCCMIQKKEAYLQKQLQGIEENIKELAIK